MWPRCRVFQNSWLVHRNHSSGHNDRHAKFVAQSFQPLPMGFSYVFPSWPVNGIVMVIPIHLLWRVQIQLRQKLALGVSLCLSIMMIISAIVQISGIRAPSHAIDVTWELFWQIVEACIAVIMVSLTAFRSLFIAHGAAALRYNRGNPNPGVRHRFDSRNFWRKRVSDDSEESQRLPRIPRATMTGLRTFIRGETTEESAARSVRSSNDRDSMTMDLNMADRRFPVAHVIWTEMDFNANKERSDHG